MHNASDEIVNVAPPFQLREGIETWKEFEEELETYKRKNHLKFRVRSSERTVLYNSTHKNQIPSEFEWTHKIYRCTHGVSQGSRSKGHRNRQSRYRGCKTRLTAIVTRVSGSYNIVIRNENHTHSHPTGPNQTSWYLTAKAMPLDDHDREDVKTLADACVSSTHIASFLNDRIGCKVTPQQARNLIRSITGQDSGENVLKDMLHSLRQLDGSDVLVVQDQMDVTCGIVMQTKVQKLMFERWGETLAMDFTHGTNNLGYHLGSLVVTTATGRGFPVVDFICLNEQAKTISTILEYFKEKNPRWQDVATVVIDKDFVEWQVLEESFPTANILLCQFHAISYWKKVMKRPVYRLKITQREDLLLMTIKLLYSVTKDAYETGYEELKQYCMTNRRQAFLTYFEKNWNTCRGMWANFSRGKHFTAGNTTTNRIESNWNQLKMLLGMKTRIDKTIAGLLQHQMTITQQIVTELEKHHTSSRMPKTVSRFLRAVAGRLSTNMLEKVKREWERFVNQMDITTCERSSSSWMWNVHCSNQSFRCHDLDWTCTCLFYTSNHLPCRHLMYLTSKGQGLDKFPANAIHNRWSTFAALDVKDELAAAADSLQTIVCMSKLRLPKVRLPEGNDEMEASASPEVVKEVVYVRLRRNERAKKIVLSSAEKYCYAKAMLEPLLEHLSNLSSARFYQELNAWKETVEVGLRRGGNASGSCEACTDGGSGNEDEKVSAEGIFSILDPADEIGTANITEEMEMTNTDGVTDDSSDDDVPPTQLASVAEKASAEEEEEVKAEAEGGIQPQGLSSTSLQSEADAKRSNEDGRDETPAHESLTAVLVRQVDIINMPKPKRRSNPRSTTKQLRQTKIIPDRLALHKYPSGLTVPLNELLQWARNAPNMKFVLEMLNKYPVQLEDAYLRARTIECEWEVMQSADYMHKFVIPVDLTRSMQAAITAAKNEQRKPDEMHDTVKKQGFVLDMVASIDPKLWKFSGQFVGALTGFHAIKTMGHMWFEDRKWLEQDWRRITSDVDIFAKATSADGISADAVRDRHQVLANEVISKFASSRMRTEFVTLSGKGMITFENIVGGVCRGWLNDSPIDFCLETIAESAGNCCVLSSLMWACRWPSLPKISLGDTKFIVHPVKLAANHWGVIIVRLTLKETTKTTLQVHAYKYEPLIDDEYHKEGNCVGRNTKERQEL